jgi:hypothetical protein
MHRGEVWRINLDPTMGAEIKKTRPAVIVNDGQAGQVLPDRLPVVRKRSGKRKEVRRFQPFQKNFIILWTSPPLLPKPFSRNAEDGKTPEVLRKL